MRARENPFRVEQIHQLTYRPMSMSWEEVMDRLEALSYRAAVVGPEGTGKTTFLEQLIPRLAAQGFEPQYLRVRPSMCSAVGLPKLFSDLSSNCVLLVDGSELLSGLAWWRFRRLSRKLAGLIVSLHQPGRMPTLFETETSGELFNTLAQDLIGREATQRAAQELDKLFAASDGNVRLAFRKCYDTYAEHGSLP